MSPAPSPWTWQEICRVSGLLIVIALLVAFLAGFATGRHLDTTLTLAFLGVASSLIGIPSGWQLIRRDEPPK